MTVDDDSSIYVGGLPYETSEEGLRRVFEIYGSVVAVKIINDHAIGGKCYGFVTFRNPRSAIHAIEEMDGRAIDGRVVKVNEVTTRGGRSNFGREISRRNSGRGVGWDRGRDRERDSDHGGEEYRDRHRDRSRGQDQGKERGYGHVHDHDRTREHFSERGRGRDQDRNMGEIEIERDRLGDHEWEREQYLDRDHDDRETERITSNQRNKDQILKLSNGTERSSGSSYVDHDQVDKQLEMWNQKHEELQNEISHMEEMAEEKRQLVSTLQEKLQNLEGALRAAKKVTSRRQMQLAKLHKCYLQIKEYGERLKNCEDELQSLADSTMTDVEAVDDY